MDLIERCLEWNPDKRITPSQALDHPWFAEITERQQQPTQQTKQPLKSTTRGINLIEQKAKADTPKHAMKKGSYGEIY
jgi:serine/threonine protein kinase